MKYTALIREVVTRDIRIIYTAGSKGEARRVVVQIAAHGTRYKNGIVASRKVDVSPVLDSIEPMTPELNERIQKELRDGTSTVCP